MSRWNSFLKAIGAVPVRPLEPDNGTNDKKEVFGVIGSSRRVNQVNKRKEKRQERASREELLNELKEINKKVTSNEASIKSLHRRIDEFHHKLEAVPTEVKMDEIRAQINSLNELTKKEFENLSEKQAHSQ